MSQTDLSPGNAVIAAAHQPGNLSGATDETARADFESSTASVLEGQDSEAPPAAWIDHAPLSPEARQVQDCYREQADEFIYTVDDDAKENREELRSTLAELQQTDAWKLTRNFANGEEMRKGLLDVATMLLEDKLQDQKFSNQSDFHQFSARALDAILKGDVTPLVLSETQFSDLYHGNDVTSSIGPHQPFHADAFAMRKGHEELGDGLVAFQQDTISPYSTIEEIYHEVSHIQNADAANEALNSYNKPFESWVDALDEFKAFSTAGSDDGLGFLEGISSPDAPEHYYPHIQQLYRDNPRFRDVVDDSVKALREDPGSVTVDDFAKALADKLDSYWKIDLRRPGDKLIEYFRMEHKANLLPPSE